MSKYNECDRELQNNEWVEEIKKELPDGFYEKRKAGENDSFICTLIQKDSIDEFTNIYLKICNDNIPPFISPE